MGACVKSILSDSGTFFFEVQYLGQIVKQHLLGTVFHEHMIHYSLTSARNFLEIHGLKVIDVSENKIQHGSVIIAAAHSSDRRKPSSSVELMIKRERDELIPSEKWTLGFVNHIKQTRTSLRTKLKQWEEENKTIFGLGAARSGPTLAIQYGLDGSLQGLIDDHPMKNGKYATFGNLFVYPWEYLDVENVGVAVVLAWIHHKPIVERARQFVSEGGELVLLWPEFQVVTKQNINSLYPE